MEYRKTKWNGFDRLDFIFEGREAILVLPERPMEARHWVLKTEYFDAFPDLEIALLQRGYYLAYVKNINRWGIRVDLDAKKRFRDFLMVEFGLAEKCIPIGMSCGGIFAIKLAGMYPGMVSVVYADAPVVNILSLLGMGSDMANLDGMNDEVYNALSMNRSQIISYREHPLDYLPYVISSKIPTCLVYGNQDTLVLWQENAKLIMEAYQGTDVPLAVFEKDGADHHPHALQGLSQQEQEALIDFLMTHDQ